MKITAVETILLRDSHTALSFDSRQEATIIKITADDGTVGYGQGEGATAAARGVPYLIRPSLLLKYV